MTTPLPTASLSLDLDNKWSYMKTHGDPGWKSLPSYLDFVIPRVLQFLDRYHLRVTFFIVGQDAAMPEHAAVLSSIVRHGHEVGNHSFHHEPWLHLYSPAQIEQELELTEDSIEKATGVRPRGFRGPGYSLSESVLRILARRAYWYDASTLPTFIGPLARTYYFMSAKLTKEERSERKKLFGTFREGLRPIRPYSWVLDDTRLLEIPVTTFPGLRIPIHMSYILYIALYNRAAALAYFRSALLACRLSGVQPSLLLHPLDFLGRGEAPELDFFPAMRMDIESKLSVLNDAFRSLTAGFDTVPLGEHARRVREVSGSELLELRWLPS